jgi:NOL1/NOP2/sun family putative RNA methylase
MKTEKHPIYGHYESIIPNVVNTGDTLTTKTPTTLWVNVLKITKETFAALLEADGFVLEPIEWHGAAFRYYGEPSIAKHWSYAAGLFQIQEEVSMLSGFILNVDAKHAVLDMCAAPGNKTAQLSISMKNRGTLIANDIDFGRMRAFGQIAKRLGLVNVSTTIYDAGSFPNTGEYFDAVMADVPCSCEGTFRKNLNTPARVSTTKQSRALAKRQFDILMKAIKLCKPGGHILYSTCTFAPIENEGVLTRALSEAADRIRIVPITIDGLDTAEGISAWEGETFHPELKKAIRLWPHMNNTGGFFICLIQKTQTSNRRETEFNPYEEADLTPYRDAMFDRFGLAQKTIDQWHFIRASKKGLYATCKNNKVPANIKVDATGVLFLKTNMQFPKISTAAAMVIGGCASRHVISLTPLQRAAYLKKEDIALLPEQVDSYFSTGYVLVHFKSIFLGLGLYFEPNDQHEHVLRSLFRLSLT